MVEPFFARRSFGAKNPPRGKFSHHLHSLLHIDVVQLTRITRQAALLFPSFAR